jgi:ABC transport system ATP-binding/permease protein
MTVTSASSAWWLSIGSRDDNDLVYERPTVSSRHAHIYWDSAAGQWMLEDLGSTNGTYLRGERLSPGWPVPVQPGDAIYLGKTFYFVLEWEQLNRVQPRSPGTSATLAHTTVPGLTPGLSGLLGLSGSDARVAASGEPAEAVPAASARAVPAAAESEPGPPPTLPGFEAPPERESAPETSSQSTQVLGDDLLRQIEARLAATMAGEPVEEVAEAPLDVFSIWIGYNDDCTVQIKNPVVSGHHARLYKLPQDFLLEDQGSTNGTWFRGQRVHRVRVTATDTFSVGNHELAVADLVHYFEVPQTLKRALSTDSLAPVGPPITIGRSPDCKIPIDAPTISAVHARIIPLGGGNYRVEDLGSTNGTFVNSRDNPVTQATVGPSDVVFFGSYRLPLSRLDSMLASPETEQALSLPQGKELMVIGREDSCDIVLKAPQVSRRHAELRRLEDGGLELRDLGSINGTYVNGQRIKTQRISPQDLVAIGSVRVRLDARAGVVRRDYHGDIMLQAERITVKVRDRSAPNGVHTILDDASFTAYPTEFVGLMGPSGAGKTTLMLALNGYTLPWAGRSLLNGYDLYTNYNTFRGNIGYVPQDDIIYRELTVWESLYYTAKLRLPADTTDAEIARRIEDVLETLEIQQTRDVVIGDAVRKGISGGQRKRVNLAQELITEPSLLFLDEPTSGLASEDTINVMNLLRRLADEGRTILLTIHQPSLEAYRKLDNVIYLFQGRLVYYGPAYPDGILYFHPEAEPSSPRGQLILSDPGNALKALADDQRRAMDAERPWETLEKTVEARRRHFQDSPQYRDYVYDRAGKPRDQVRLAEGSKRKTERRGWLRQWWILTRRNFTIKRKDLANTAILLLQAPIIGLVLWLVFSNQVGSYFGMLERGPAALFLLVASAVWFGCSNSAREVVRELPIYTRERMVNLMIPSYVLSKFTVLGALCAVQCALLLGLVYPTLGYGGNPLWLYLMLFLSSLAGVGMGMVLSSVVRSSEAAMALVPLLLIPQIVLGGIIMPIHELSAPMRVLSAAMVSRWGYEAVLHIEYADDHIAALQQRCGIDRCPDPMSIGALDEEAGLSFFPSGEAVGEELCEVLCVNARSGTEITPIERGFGLDLAGDSMRAEYQTRYGVGKDGAQVGPLVDVGVLLFMNALLFALVCAILRYRDVEVG